MPTTPLRPAASDLPFWKSLVAINGAVPLVLLIVDAFRGQLGANAVNFALHTTGILSLLFLGLSLAVTPLRQLTGWHVVVGFRRSLGLFSFFYACVHLALYVGFDRALSLTSTFDEVLKRRYLQVGLAAIVLMMPLAVTSTNAMMSRLGARRWKRLHRLAYPVAALGALHYFLLVKSDVRQPLAFAGVFAVLLASRLAWRSGNRAAADLRSRTSSQPARRRFWTGELSLIDVHDETPDVRTFRLASPDGGPLPFDYLPGQYLNLQLTIDGRRVNRSYTIASSPTRPDSCELSIKREELGLASRHLHQHLHVGDRLRISAPAGKFVFTGKESNSVVLIAGGVGITPLMSITRALTDRNWKGDIYLLFVAKTPRDIIFRDELTQLQQRFPNLHLHMSLTRVEAHDGWSGHRGRPSQDWLLQCVPELANKPVYLCGPNDMMAATRLLLLELGVPATQIHTEAFVSPGAAATPTEAAFSNSGNPVVATNTATDASIARLDGAKQAGAAAITATFDRSRTSTVVSAEMTLLEAAEAVGVDVPFECRSGVCGQCKVKLLAGFVTMDVEDALSPAEKHAGWVLACQSRCQSDVTADV